VELEEVEHVMSKQNVFMVALAALIIGLFGPLSVMHTAVAAGMAVTMAVMGTIIPNIQTVMAALGICETIRPDIAVTTLSKKATPVPSGNSGK